MFKRLIKAVLPQSLFYRIQSARARRRLATMTPRSSEEIFSNIYATGQWGNASDPTDLFFSGSGSHDALITSSYVTAVQTFLARFDERPSVVDIGCGDFSVGARLRPFCGAYTACDVVPSLINRNRKKYQHLDVTFQTLDLATDTLPPADIVFVRQVLQHLSNESIARFLPKLASNYQLLVLTEHLPLADHFIPNIDKPSGPDIRVAFNSGIVLTAPPFNLQVWSSEILCESREDAGIIRTIAYGLRP